MTVEADGLATHQVHVDEGALAKANPELVEVLVTLRSRRSPPNRRDTQRPATSSVGLMVNVWRCSRNWGSSRPECSSSTPRRQNYRLPSRRPPRRWCRRSSRKAIRSSTSSLRRRCRRRTSSPRCEEARPKRGARGRAAGATTKARSSASRTMSPSARRRPPTSTTRSPRSSARRRRRGSLSGRRCRNRRRCGALLALQSPVTLAQCVLTTAAAGAGGVGGAREGREVPTGGAACNGGNGGKGGNGGAGGGGAGGVS